MKKLLNFRLAFVSFIVSILGVVFARATLCFDNLQILFPIVLLVVASNIFVLGFVLGRKFAKVILYVCLVTLVFIMAVCSTIIKSSHLGRDFEKIENGSYTITGEISKVNYNENVIYLKNIYIEGIDETSNGSCKVYMFDGVDENIVRGDFVKLKANIYVRDVNSKIIADDQTIVAYKNSSVKPEFDKSSKLKDRFKRVVHEKLIETNSVVLVAELEYAMLFGDKDRLDDDMRNVYSVTGLAHILAVSGLHIGLVVSVVYCFIKKFVKGKYYISLLITTIFIALYLYLCDFAISAVRAVLMTTVIYYARARGKLYDGLSGLGLAGTIILLFNPFDLFDVGFELSFAVVFSLFTLSPPILRFFKIYLPQKLAGSLSVCCSTFIGSSLIIAYYFNSCSILAIFTNFIIIPIVSISFSLLFVFVMIVSIIPVLDFALIVPNFVFNLVNIIAGSIANMKGVSVLFSTNIVGVVLGLIAIFILSDYVFLSRKQKAVIVGIVACIIGMTVVSEVYDVLESEIDGGFVWNSLSWNHL